MNMRLSKYEQATLSLERSEERDLWNIVEKTFCLLTIAGLGICIGMSNSESPISEKKPPVIVQEVEQNQK